MAEQINLIGIGGLPRSGKDTLAEVFIENGFYGVSLGDIVRDESRTRHADSPDPISIANMTETANWLRQNKGSEFALISALERYKQAMVAKQYKGLAVFSVRMQVEVDFILSNGGEVVWVETDDDTRYERYMQHLREGEVAISKEELMKQEAQQWQPQPGIDPSIQMNVSYVKEHATRTFVNNGNDLADFNAHAEALVAELS